DLETGGFGAAVGADHDIQPLTVEVDLAHGFERLGARRPLIGDDGDLLAPFVRIDDAAAQQGQQGGRSHNNSQTHQFASAGAEWMTRVVGFSVAMMMQPDSMGAATAAAARAMMRRRIGFSRVDWPKTASVAVPDHVNNRKGCGRAAQAAVLAVAGITAAPCDRASASGWGRPSR